MKKKQPNYELAMMMSARDYFAAQALSAYLQRYTPTGRNEEEYEQSNMELARHAYRWADRMIKTREEKP